MMIMKVLLLLLFMMREPEKESKEVWNVFMLLLAASVGTFVLLGHAIESELNPLIRSTQLTNFR
jgi:TctA family transporter